MIVDGRTIDRERMRIYTEKLLASGLYASLGGYYVNSPRPIATFEGTTGVDHVTLVIRFPCLTNARAFWYSRTYQEAIKPLRLDPLAGDFTVRIYPEIPAPSYMAGKVEGDRYLSAFPAERVPLVQVMEETAAVHPTPNIRRTTLVVANIDRSLAFYSDLLGFTAGAVRTLNTEGSGYLLFDIPRHLRARFVTLSAGETQREILGLIESPSYTSKRPMGDRSAALVVKLPVALEEIVPRLAAAGATVLSPSAAAGNKEQAVLDPDGHLVLLYELAR